MKFKLRPICILFIFLFSCVATYNLLEMKPSYTKSYGYSSKDPIKVGGVYQNQGVQREYQYSSMLEGLDNQPLKINRIGSCCDFKYGLNQIGLLDNFAITYDGLNDTIYLYLDMYRMDGLPKIPIGFKLKQINQKKQ